MNKSQINAIGNTPIIQLNNFSPSTNLFAKLESQNPLFSVKDRAAWGMIDLAQREGRLKKGGSIVEPTSGNTGIALAWISRILGYKLILTMPETMSVERRNILKFLGAKIVLTQGPKGMKGAIEEARKIHKEKDIFMPNQFSNPGNAEIHQKTTGPEIWRTMEEKLDWAVFGVGTGGTLTGAGRFLKSKDPNIKIVAVEPTESAVLSGNDPGPHKIQGIGAGFIPSILDTNLIDRIEQVSGDKAIQVSQELARAEGVFAGISSGAAAIAARKIAKENPDQRVVVILPDTGERYLSTDLFRGI